MLAAGSEGRSVPNPIDAKRTCTGRLRARSRGPWGRRHRCIRRRWGASVKRIAVIPARWGSTRLPGKALAPIDGRPMIQHVWSRASEARQVDEVWIATDDPRIAEAATAFGARVAMTASTHPSGTDRVEEAARATDADVVVNVQGDEPQLDPAQVDLVVSTLLGAGDGDGAEVATLAFPLSSADELADPNLVKVVTDRRGRALYFSRAPIPYDRGSGGAVTAQHRGHVGLYAFRREALARFVRLPRGPLESLESLEQLRFLENGIPIAVGHTSHRTVGVDTPEDLERVRAEIGRAGER